MPNRFQNHRTRKINPVILFKNKFGDLANSIIFDLADFFLSKSHPTAPEAADKVNERFKLQNNQKLTFRDVFQAVRAAIELKYIKLEPPVEEKLASALKAKFPLDPTQVDDRTVFHVVDVLPANDDSLAVQ